jgi:hypothetical protein
VPLGLHFQISWSCRVVRVTPFVFEVMMNIQEVAKLHTC